MPCCFMSYRHCLPVFRISPGSPPRVLWRFHNRQVKLECCERKDPRNAENVEDWEVECSENNDPIAHCVDNVQEVDSEASPSEPDGHERVSTECGKGPRPTEHDIAMFKAAKRREHFEGMVPGSLTSYPWRSIFYGRGRPKCVRRPSSLYSSG